MAFRNAQQAAMDEAEDFEDVEYDEDEEYTEEDEEEVDEDDEGDEEFDGQIEEGKCFGLCFRIGRLWCDRDNLLSKPCFAVDTEDEQVQYAPGRAAAMRQGAVLQDFQCSCSDDDYQLPQNLAHLLVAGTTAASTPAVRPWSGIATLPVSVPDCVLLVT